mmetsp:Transcript_45933/g.99887  ORF Transcript_45933/g.99887 Transcript_45933/m.99887 type:complete len:273 (+) Transcript_45933:905-1723(+)
MSSSTGCNRNASIRKTCRAQAPSPRDSGAAPQCCKRRRVPTATPMTETLSPWRRSSVRCSTQFSAPMCLGHSSTVPSPLHAPSTSTASGMTKLRGRSDRLSRRAATATAMRPTQPTAAAGCGAACCVGSSPARSSAQTCLSLRRSRSASPISSSLMLRSPLARTRCCGSSSSSSEIACTSTFCARASKRRTVSTSSCSRPARRSQLSPPLPVPTSPRRRTRSRSEWRLTTRKRATCCPYRLGAERCDTSRRCFVLQSAVIGWWQSPPYNLGQ